jgi:hypothetical protein
MLAKATASNNAVSFFMGLNPPGAGLSHRASDVAQNVEKGSENGTDG